MVSMAKTAMLLTTAVWTVLALVACMSTPISGCCRQMPCPTITPTPMSKSCKIPLTTDQVARINQAIDSGFVELLKNNRNITYNNRQPIITDFTREQTTSLLEMNREYFDRSRDSQLRLWYDDGSNPASPTNQSTSSGAAAKGRRKRTTISRVCPVMEVTDLLITAFNADGEVLQIVQLPGVEQWVLRHHCQNGQSYTAEEIGGAGVVSCDETIRLVFLVAIRLDAASAFDGMTVEEVQVESCTSLL